MVWGEEGGLRGEWFEWFGRGGGLDGLEKEWFEGGLGG